MAVFSVTDGATAARRPAGSRDQGDSDMSNDTYKREYTREFVSRWDRLIGWNSRAEGENGFFERLLRRHACREVADIPAGTGFHANRLADDGFAVNASDGAEPPTQQTERHANALGENRRTTCRAK